MEMDGVVADHCSVDTELHLFWICGFDVTQFLAYIKLPSNRLQFTQEEAEFLSQAELYWNSIPASY